VSVDSATRERLVSPARRGGQEINASGILRRGVFEDETAEAMAGCHE
jgi:hypothetical protein